MSAAPARKPWLKFWPADWAGDRKLHGCSLAARGLWIELCCLMHEARPYGHLVHAGKPMPVDRIARQAACSVEEVELLLAELDEAGVISRNEQGVIFSRRMVRDEEMSVRGREDRARAISKGGVEGTLQGSLEGSLQGPPPRVPSRGPSKGPFNPREPLASSDCSGLPDPHGLPECSIPTSLRSVAGGSVPPPPEPPPKVEVPPPPVVELVPAKAKRAPRKPAQGPHPEAIRIWEETWLETHGTPWVWTGKEAKAVAACLKLAKGDLEDYRARVNRILRDPPDRWTAQNASPSLLAERWNQITVRTVGRAQERQIADLRESVQAVDDLDQSGFFDQFDENGRLRA
jgi:hypothetical protein